MKNQSCFSICNATNCTRRQNQGERSQQPRPIIVITDLVFSKLTFCTVLQFPDPTMEDDKENVNVDVSGEQVNMFTTP